MGEGKASFNPLDPHNDLDKPLPALGERTAAMGAVDQMFLDRAKNALRELGQSPLEFLSANPGVAQIELAKRLGRGTNALGLIHAIYEEAAQNGVVRDVAKDLLLRTIHTQFSEGWRTGGPVSAYVKLSSWHNHIKDFLSDPQAASAANQILFEVAIDRQPPELWLPKYPTDALIDTLFDRFWPAEVPKVGRG